MTPEQIEDLLSDLQDAEEAALLAADIAQDSFVGPEMFVKQAGLYARAHEAVSLLLKDA